MLPCYYRVFSLLLVFSIDAARAYTSGSFLFDTLVRDHPVQDVLEYHPNKHTECRTPPTGPIETTHCDFEAVESVSDDLFANLDQLVKTPFFKYFQLDLYRDCPFWEENGSCGSRECAITSVDESSVPEKWRVAALSKVELPSSDKRTQLPGCYYRDSDFCFLDDMTGNTCHLPQKNEGD
jgi:ERO1-like protein beta